MRWCARRRARARAFDSRMLRAPFSLSVMPKRARGADAAEAVTWRYAQTSKLGVLGMCVRLDGSGVCGLRFLTDVPTEAQPVCPDADEWLRLTLDWVEGRSKSLPRLPLALVGTPFQLRVWGELLLIPPGKTASYGEIAAKLGSAARAVGGAVGRNRVAILVPCHRVLAAGGGIGGFSSDGRADRVDLKRVLLDLEKTAS